MLRLVFYTGDRLLKVRHALPEDSFSSSFIWDKKLEFIVSPEASFTMTWTSLLPDLEPIYAEALVSLVGARYPVSQDYKKLEALCSDLIFINGSREWVFFAGTFNPWHKGHQACINLLPDDKLCFIAPDRNPYKELREVSIVSEVLKVSTHARFKKNQFLVPTFLLEQKKNPTIDWVLRLKEHLPGHEVSLLMGFDSFSELKNWTRSSELLPEINTVYVVSRLEEDEDRRLALDEAHARNQNLNVIFLGRHEFEGISSTEIRNKK